MFSVLVTFIIYLFFYYFFIFRGVVFLVTYVCVYLWVVVVTLKNMNTWLHARTISVQCITILISWSMPLCPYSEVTIRQLPARVQLIKHLIASDYKNIIFFTYELVTLWKGMYYVLWTIWPLQCTNYPY